MAEDILSAIPMRKIYRPSALWIAVLLGGPVAVIMIISKKRIGIINPRPGRMIYFFCVLCLLAIIRLNSAHPFFSYFPWYYFLLNAIIGSWLSLSILPANLHDHLESGGGFYSTWKGLSFGLICMLLTCVLIVFGVFLWDLLHFNMNLHFPRVTELMIFV